MIYVWAYIYMPTLHFLLMPFQFLAREQRYMMAISVLKTLNIGSGYKTVTIPSNLSVIFLKIPS